MKHGVRIDISNLYSDEVGNPQLPKKLEAVKKHHAQVRWAAVAIGLLVVGAIVAAFMIVSRRPTTSLTAIPEKSIAVLPFVDMSAGKDPKGLFLGRNQRVKCIHSKSTDCRSAQNYAVLVSEIVRKSPRARAIVVTERQRGGGDAAEHLVVRAGLAWFQAVNRTTRFGFKQNGAEQCAFLFF